MSRTLPPTTEILEAMRLYFPDPDFVAHLQYDISSNCQLFQVYHRPSARVVTTAVDSAIYDEFFNGPELFRDTMKNIQHSMYSDLAAQGYGGLPFEPGNPDHEMIKGLCYLAGYKLVEHMPAGADTRGDALIYLVPENNASRPLNERTADLMPPKCLALPLDYWRQLLTKRLNNTLAKKSAII